MNERPTTRDSIFGLIEENPGIHFREIQRRSGLAVGQVEYHLYQLERDEKIVTRQDGKVKRFFCVNSDSYSERQLLFYLRSSNSREVLQKLAHGSNVTMSSLLRVRKSKLEKRKEVISSLMRDRIIESYESRGVELVRIKDLRSVLDAARKYRESFIETLSDSFLSLVDED